MKPFILCASALSLALASAGLSAGGSRHAPAAPTAHAAPPTTLGPARTGQPNQSCETTPNQPGRSMTAPGSAFNPTGTSGSVYAGEQPQNSRNTASVSQYDVACARSR
jgi:hypothetical protein